MKREPKRPTMQRFQRQRFFFDFGLKGAFSGPGATKTEPGPKKTIGGRSGHPGPRLGKSHRRTSGSKRVGGGRKRSQGTRMVWAGNCRAMPPGARGRPWGPAGGPASQKLRPGPPWKQFFQKQKCRTDVSCDSREPPAASEEPLEITGDPRAPPARTGGRARSGGGEGKGEGEKGEDDEDDSGLGRRSGPRHHGVRHQWAPAWTREVAIAFFLPFFLHWM